MFASISLSPPSMFLNIVIMLIDVINVYGNNECNDLLQKYGYPKSCDVNCKHSVICYVSF